MSVKRFVAPDMSKALRKVTEELGPDAVILSSRSTDDGVEVLTLPSGYLESREKPRTSPLARRYAEEEVEIRRRATEVDETLAEERAKRRAELLAKARSKTASSQRNEREDHVTEPHTTIVNDSSEASSRSESDAMAEFELDSEQQIEAMLRDMPEDAVGDLDNAFDELTFSDTNAAGVADFVDESLSITLDDEVPMLDVSGADSLAGHKQRYNDSDIMRQTIKSGASKLAQSLQALDALPKATASDLQRHPTADEAQNEALFDPLRFVDGQSSKQPFHESGSEPETSKFSDTMHEPSWTNDVEHSASSRLRRSLEDEQLAARVTPDSTDNSMQSLLDDVSVPAMTSASDASLSALQLQLDQVKQLLEQRLEAQSGVGGSRKSSDDYIEPHQYTVMQRLAALGLPKSFATRCYRAAEHALSQADEVEDVTRFAWLKSLRYLADQLPIDLSDPVMQGGIHAFIGPSGAGKTSIIAKLVTRYVLEHGKEHVAIISTDNFALGARASLETLGKILDVPVYPVDSSHDLDSRIRECAACQLLLIDTPGMSRGEMQDSASLAQLDLLGGRVNRHLVLPSVMQAKYAERFIEALGVDVVRSAIITRVDEAVALGEIITVLIEKQLPISYWADGPNMPEYLHTAKRSECIQQILLSAGIRFDDDAIAEDGPLTANPYDEGSDNEQDYA